VIVRLIEQQYRDLLHHLFSGHVEQVAFGFAEWEVRDGGPLEVLDLELIPASGFVLQSDYHVELSPETQSRIIKIAFDRRACLVEFHSHRSRWPAQFSGSDLSGFDDFVPHVRWRLAGRPYAALVFHETSFDGLAWIGASPSQVEGVQIGGGQLRRSTRLTLSSLKITRRRLDGRRTV
jgi:hypothetical protein